MPKRKKSSRQSWIETGAALAITAVLILGGYALTKSVKQDEAKKQAVQMVKLVTPPPPPNPLEKLPEPEIQKEVPEEQMVEVPQDAPQQADQGPPPGQDLGVDTEGGAGGDAFGLVGRKGGRDLIGSGAGGGDGGLMQKYGWYVRLLEEEIGRHMVKKAKLPGGGLQVYVRIVLDREGDIVSHTIYGSSGDSRVDSAVNDALQVIRRVSEPPPEGMPRALKIRITLPA